MAHLKVTIVNTTDLAGIGNLNLPVIDADIPPELVSPAREIFALIGATASPSGQEFDKKLTMSGKIPINFLALHLSRTVSDTVDCQIEITDDAGDAPVTGSGTTPQGVQQGGVGTELERAVVGNLLDRIPVVEDFAKEAAARIQEVEGFVNEAKPVLDLIPGLGSRISDVETLLNEFANLFQTHVTATPSEAHAPEPVVPKEPELTTEEPETPSEAVQDAPVATDGDPQVSQDGQD